jgi:hypothetical protein
MTFPLMRSCREVVALLVAQEDRALSRADRIALRMHLMVCKTCPRFEKQMLTMRNGLRQWRNYTGPDDANGAEHPVK